MGSGTRQPGARSNGSSSKFATTMRFTDVDITEDTAGIHCFRQACRRNWREHARANNGSRRSSASSNSMDMKKPGRRPDAERSCNRCSRRLSRSLSTTTDWLFELKLDGMRAIVDKKRRRNSTCGRATAKVLTDRFPTLAEAFADLSRRYGGSRRRNRRVSMKRAIRTSI